MLSICEWCVVKVFSDDEVTIILEVLIRPRNCFCYGIRYDHIRKRLYNMEPPYKGHVSLGSEAAGTPFSDRHTAIYCPRVKSEYQRGTAR